MLVIKPVSAGRERYWMTGPGPGHWHGGAARGLGLEGEVHGGALRALLAGAPLRRVHSRRRAGFDLIYAAPKSVSLLAALAPPDAGAAIVAAHEAAVLDALGYLERHAATARRDRGSRVTATDGLAAAVFRHAENRAGEPHLHSHVVVPNVVHAADGQWSCLDSRHLYRHGAASGAVYQAALRHHLGLAGFALAWRLHDNGLCDVAQVPRAAIDACSTRRRQVLDRQRERPAPGWMKRAAVAGLDKTTAARLATRVPGRGEDWRPDLAAVREVLERRCGTFRFTDVVRALAATAASGAPAMEVERHAARLLARAVPLSEGAGEQRWNTVEDLDLQRRLIEGATGRHGRGPPAGSVAPRLIESALAGRPALEQAARRAVQQLAGDGHDVVVVAARSRVIQAQVIEAAHAAWSAGHHRVSLAASSEVEQARWRALTGVEAAAGATVIVVPGAERLPARTLAGVLDGAARDRTKVVLIDTGSRAASKVVEELGRRFGAVDPGTQVGLEPQPAVLATTIVAAASTGDMLGQLVADGLRRRQPVIAMGMDEVTVLNNAARALAAGALHGPTVEIGGRPFQAGDRILALRGGQLGTVTAVDTRLGCLTVRGDDDREVEVSGRTRVGYGYATTPAYGPGTPAYGPGTPAYGPGLGTTHVVAAAPAPIEVAAGRAKMHHTLAELAGERGPEVDAAIVLRTAALAAAARHAPSPAVLALLGPPPPVEETRQRQAWQRAAAAMEIHRDRFGGDRGPAQLASELAVRAACRAVQRDRSLTLE